MQSKCHQDNDLVLQCSCDNRRTRMSDRVSTFGKPKKLPNKILHSQYLCHFKCGQNKTYVNMCYYNYCDKKGVWICPTFSDTFFYLNEKVWNWDFAEQFFRWRFWVFVGVIFDSFQQLKMQSSNYAWCNFSSFFYSFLNFKMQRLTNLIIAWSPARYKKVMFNLKFLVGGQVGTNTFCVQIEIIILHTHPSRLIWSAVNRTVLNPDL